MGSVIIDNPGPADFTVSNGTSDHLVPPHALVHLRDSSLLVELDYSDLDTLDETIDMLCDARRKLTEKWFAWRGQMTPAVALGHNDEILDGGRRLVVDTVMIENTGVTIHAIDAADGTPHGMVVARDAEYLTVVARHLQTVR